MLSIKKKDLFLHHDTNILEKEEAFKEYEQYTCLLVRFRKLKREIVVPSPYGEKTVQKEGQYWLMIVPRNGNVFLTAQFDETGNFIEVYFDVNRGNDFSDPDDPVFEDMFLDAVLDREKRVYVLDESDLEEALSLKIISEQEYRETRDTADQLVSYLRCHAEETIRHCEYIFKEMKEEMEK